jgi:hypothetical protein
MHTLLDNASIKPGVKSGSYAGTAAGSNTFGSAVSMSGFDSVTFLLQGTCATQAGSVTLTAYSATSAAAAGSAAISGAALTFVGTAVAADTHQIHALTVKADQLPAASPFILPVLTVWGNSMVFLGDVVTVRYNPRNLPPTNTDVLTDTMLVA